MESGCVFVSASGTYARFHEGGPVSSCWTGILTSVTGSFGSPPFSLPVLSATSPPFSAMVGLDAFTITAIDPYQPTSDAN
jgi:hypothetical protein